MINHWILKFNSSELEQDFNEGYFERELKVFQYSLVLGIVTYLIFISLDFVMYENSSVFYAFLINRLSIVVLVSSFLAFSFYHIKKHFHLQILAIITTLTSFFSHVVFTFVDGIDEFYFYTANSILIIFLFTMLNIRFRYLVFLALVLIATHLSILYLNFSFDIKKFTHQGYGIVAVSIISLISSRVIEFQKRKDFLNQRLIQEQKEAILNYNWELQNTLKEKNALLQELKEKNAELDAFNHSVSHDLKTPIRNINLFTKLLIKKHNSEFSKEALEYLEFIIDGTHKMTGLVEDLLNYSKIRHTQLNKKRLDMNNLVEDIFTEQARPLERKPILEKSMLPTAKADPILMKQVWANLISNAIKYSSKTDQSYIKVGANKNRKEVTYWIQDNGIGFEMEFANKLFTLFSRLHSEQDFKGTGVGLSLVDRIIKKHGGKIWAESEPNRGSTFYFTLPAISNISVIAAN